VTDLDHRTDLVAAAVLSVRCGWWEQRQHARRLPAEADSVDPDILTRTFVINVVAARSWPSWPSTSEMVPSSSTSA
jgi:hypothetical protein